MINILEKLDVRLLFDISPRNMLVGALEEALYKSATKGDNIVWLWKQPKCIYMTKIASVLYLDRDYIATTDFKVTRSALFPAKPTSSVIAGDTTWGILFFVNGLNVEEQRELTKYLLETFWIDVTKDMVGVELESTGNDLVVKGTDRKISGRVNERLGTISSGHMMFSDKSPDSEYLDIDKVYKLPDSKFDGKSVSKPSQRVTSIFSESGKHLDDVVLYNKLKDALKFMGATINEDHISVEELREAESLMVKHASQEFITYGDRGEKPDFE